MECFAAVTEPHVLTPCLISGEPFGSFVQLKSSKYASPTSFKDSTCEKSPNTSPYIIQNGENVSPTGETNHVRHHLG
jgi:hypothetical protein